MKSKSVSVNITANGLAAKNAQDAADAVKFDLINTQKDVAHVKITANDLTTSIENVKGDISQLQQDAKSIKLSISGPSLDLFKGLDGEFAMAYGIPVTHWQDDNACLTLPTTAAHDEVLPLNAPFSYYAWKAGKTYTQSIIIETDAQIDTSVKPQWTWYTWADGTPIHNPQPAELIDLGNHCYRLIGSYTPNSTDARRSVRILDIYNFTSFVNVKTGTYLKFRSPHFFCADDNSLSQLKITADSLDAYIQRSTGSKILSSLLSMDPNNSTIGQVVNGHVVAAINTSSDGQVRIDGRKIQLTGDTTILGQLNLLPLKERHFDLFPFKYHNPWAWSNATVYAGGGGIQLQSTVDRQSYSDNTSISGIRGGSPAITTLAPTYLKFSLYPSWRDVDVDKNRFDNQLCRTYIDAGRIETNDVHVGNLRFIGTKIQGKHDSVYVSNENGTNFDNHGWVGFQVWGGLGLGKQTLYTPRSDLYIQNGNVGPGIDDSYSSSRKVDVHCHKVISDVANTISSRLSVKTAITKVSYDRALMAVQNTDMYDYRYVNDESGQHYVSGIIDDVHDKPEYNMDTMLINKDRTARIDANLLGYHHVIIQKLLDRVATLEAKVK